MELYNFIRIFGAVIKIASFRTSKAKRCENDLHRALNSIQFQQTHTRRAIKLALQCVFAYAVYYAVRWSEISTGQLNSAYLGTAIAFFTLFHAEIKIGISNDSDRRVGEVNDNMKSGYTEWFAIPWPFVFFIPLVTWFRVSPLRALIGVIVIFSAIFVLCR